MLLDVFATLASIGSGEKFFEVTRFKRYGPSFRVIRKSS